MAPPNLAIQLHSLPPILHILYQITMSSCSKGSRGLSVRSRVGGIFTATSISPSSWLRQRPSRYTIRAGRNLPDKEFRYLRTVIVTAAVYWGFTSELRQHLNPLCLFNFSNKLYCEFRCCLTPPLNLPAPGRCQSIYRDLRLRIDLCF